MITPASSRTLPTLEAISFSKTSSSLSAQRLWDVLFIRTRLCWAPLTFTKAPLVFWGSRWTLPLGSPSPPAPLEVWISCASSVLLHGSVLAFHWCWCTSGYPLLHRRFQDARHCIWFVQRFSLRTQESAWHITSSTLLNVNDELAPACLQALPLYLFFSVQCQITFSVQASLFFLFVFIAEEIENDTLCPKRNPPLLLPLPNIIVSQTIHFKMNSSRLLENNLWEIMYSPWKWSCILTY